MLVMQNRSYTKHNRRIKQVRLGVWECRIAPVKGSSDIPPIEVTSNKAAFDWLHAGPDKLLPPANIPAAIRAQILERQKKVLDKLKKRTTRLKLAEKNKPHKREMRRRKLAAIAKNKAKKENGK